MNPAEFRQLLLERFASVEMLSDGRLSSFDAVPYMYTNLRCSGYRLN